MDRGSLLVLVGIIAVIGILTIGGAIRRDIIDNRGITITQGDYLLIKKDPTTHTEHYIVLKDIIDSIPELAIISLYENLYGVNENKLIDQKLAKEGERFYLGSYLIEVKEINSSLGYAIINVKN